MELCFEGSKGKNTQPLSISCPTVQRVPDGQMGGYVTYWVGDNTKPHSLVENLWQLALELNGVSRKI